MATRDPFSLRIRRMVITSPTVYCLVSIATTLQEERETLLFSSSRIRPPKRRHILVLPLQVGRVNGLVANGTLGPALVTQRQVVQHARPAEDVSAAGDARCHRGVQTDGARRHLVTVDALETHTRRRSVNASQLKTQVIKFFPPISICEL